jgi:hypothetical protein
MTGRSKWPPPRSSGFVLGYRSSGDGFVDRMWQMPISESARAAAGIHRKLRGLAAVFADLAATEHEKATAKELKGRLEKRLGEEAKPESAWTGIMFRRGQGVKEMTSPSFSKDGLDTSCLSAWQMFRSGFKR